MKRKCCANPLYRRDHRDCPLPGPNGLRNLFLVCLRGAAPAVHEQHRTAIHAPGQSIGSMIPPPTREVLFRTSGNDDRIVQIITLAALGSVSEPFRSGWGLAPNAARPASSYVSEISRSSWLRTPTKENSDQATDAPMTPNATNTAIFCHAAPETSATGAANK
jgi:hypothetical protein